MTYPQTGKGHVKGPFFSVDFEIVFEAILIMMKADIDE